MIEKALESFQAVLLENTQIAPESYNNYKVKRGLRNSDGTGVLAGLTNIGNVHGYIVSEDEKVADEGRLRYRGIDVADIVASCAREKRFGYEEVCYLILFGRLPNQAELKAFNELLCTLRPVPYDFREDVIMRCPSPNIMNKLARAVLTNYSYDPNADDTSLSNMIRQALLLVARVPTMVAYAYQAKLHYYDGKSLYIHHPQADLSTAENFLYMIRSNNKFSPLEAEILDLALILHAEHGGGNNSAFTTRVVASSGSDTYSAIAAAIGSLKGPRHGGANQKVMGMIEDFKQNIEDIGDADQVAAYIEKTLKRETYDHSGLVYGMGHAIYTLSDPRAVMLKQKAAKLAEITGNEKEFKLYCMIEELTPQIFARVRGSKVMCANVDLYSGFVYKMLHIPPELYTPMFAIARMAGWCAHRIEEGLYGSRIIRPAYKSVCKTRDYTPIHER
ncbi:MAG: citrate/2-methylcitrate synthase [Ruminococcaceae bacterium]|nr:citrate/2-methylcitrate synthase [Oscillospiraceae bacterium]